MSEIVYKDKIIKAYRNIPVMGINDIPFGAIINRTPGELSWWPPSDGAERFGITANIPPIRGIIPWQRHYFSGSDYVYSSHSMVHTFRGRYFETASPKSGFGILTPRNLDPNKVYLICVYSDAVVNTGAGRQCFYDVFNRLDGTGYDYFQIVNILIHDLLDWPEDEYFSMIDMGKNKKVCSVTAAVCWLNFYYKFMRKNGMPGRRPLGDWNAERVPPCLFEMPLYNNGTFKIIGRLKSGLID